MPRGCGRRTCEPASANSAAMSSKSSESRDEDGSSTSASTQGVTGSSRITSMVTSSYTTDTRLLRSAIRPPPVGSSWRQTTTVEAGAEPGSIAAGQRDHSGCNRQRSTRDGQDGTVAYVDGVFVALQVQKAVQ